MKPIRSLLLLPLLAFAIAAPLRAATFTATKVADSDDGTCDVDCSLREATSAANANAKADSIVFDLLGSGTRTLNLGAIGDSTFGPSALLVTSALTIDDGH